MRAAINLRPKTPLSRLVKSGDHTCPRNHRIDSKVRFPLAASLREQAFNSFTHSSFDMIG